MSEPGRKTIGSVETAIELLDAIRERGAATPTELAEEFDRSKSTIHHYLATLEDRGCLENRGGEYRLGLRLLTFGGPARAEEKLYDLGRDTVDRLSEETGEQARLIAERDGAGITLYQATGDHDDATPTHVGSVEELHCTAAGKAFLAALPDDRARELLDAAELTAYTDRTITDRDELWAELDAIRERGVAFDDAERYEGVRCVAAAITDENDDLLGAISVSGAADRLTGERYRETIPDKIRNSAGVVEINTTYSEWAAGD